MRSCFLSAVALTMMTSAPALAGPMQQGQAAAEAFLRGETHALWSSMTPEMQQAAGSKAALAALRASISGDETVLNETLRPEGAMQLYQRLSRFGDITISIAVALDGDSRVAGFLVQPLPEAAPSAYLDHQTKAALRLPFDGRWHVFWGGRDIADNYHAADPGQRFALDLVVLENGTSHAGDASKLASYHCWDRPILSPGDGIVVAVVDGLPDQPIGSTDPENPAGNHAVIDFGTGEYGFLAHLRDGSVAVTQGDRIAAGTKIGRCGNSGNTSEPHLHFHLQTTPVLGAGHGLPAQFLNWRADGVTAARGEPRRGQQIETAD